MYTIIIMLFFIYLVKKYMILKRNKLSKNKRSISIRKYFFISSITVFLLNLLIIFHAVFAIVNVVIAVLFIVFYFKSIKKDNTRIYLSLSYTLTIIFCASFSIMMSILLIYAFILSIFGKIEFAQLIATV